MTRFFSPSARSPFGRRPFYPDNPVDPVQFSFKDENPFLFLPYFKLRFFTFLFRLSWPLRWPGLNNEPQCHEVLNCCAKSFLNRQNTFIRRSMLDVRCSMFISFFSIKLAALQASDGAYVNHEKNTQYRIWIFNEVQY